MTQDNDRLVDKEDVNVDIPLRTASSNCLDKQFCSRAVTGSTPVFQAIYICHTCCGDGQDVGGENQPLCICSACVSECHASHDIEYIGMGPCYCDCQDFDCKILTESIDEAAQLGFIATNNVDTVNPFHSIIPTNVKSTDPYIRDIYHIPLLQDHVIRDVLVSQARELVRHSKDTFWLDSETMLSAKKSGRQKICELEHFAWAIFSRHLEYYFSWTDNDERFSTMGAEWWVQVKPMSSETQKSSLRLESPANDTEAIDLHYDKDEEMAAKFGIGMFPSLSTVTYFTYTENSSPTIVFPRRYDEVDDDDGENEHTISNMFISHPKMAKHIAFDGRLLHGAPSHYLLRNPVPSISNDGKNENPDIKARKQSDEQMSRITFLVNVWLGHKPVGVSVLPETIRAAIDETTNRHEEKIHLEDTEIRIIPSPPIHEMTLRNENDLPDYMRKRIDLPFVGGKSTWASRQQQPDEVEQDTENEITVTTYPPPPHPNYDSILLHFGHGLEAKFNYLDEELEE